MCNTFLCIIQFHSFNAYSQNAPIVAKVNNEKISLETIIQAINDLPQEIQSQPFISYYEELLERVIDIKLLAQEGKKINDYNTYGLINDDNNPPNIKLEEGKMENPKQEKQKTFDDDYNRMMSERNQFK